MSSFELIRDLFNQYLLKYPQSSITLNTLRSQEQEDRLEFGRFIDFARHVQTRQPIYETVYRRLDHLYVLCGSRVDLLEALTR